ncbi:MULTISPECIES: Dam family site-specific DNA-(adenine-N6)-methyltransferase [Pseudoalteromonas]|uniref:Dam family site-specific DNA-(adenine-N6)-methyltransferase n=1 Tax=Pseudoalteromonas TaxID=53246 RepID=UPI0019108229|nr:MULTISPECIES: Dam family site-specific DNA-(adenine-N6)-methyltransferase [Pseudoalteromonas]
MGSKDLIVSEIYNLLDKKKLVNKNLRLFDAFCGTGAVSDALKGAFNIIANDNLSWSVEYTRGRLVSESCSFSKLGFDPFVFFNTNNTKIKGFFYNNYSPGGSQRMYFSEDNAARIDYFRTTIEEWKNKDEIDENEYSYLIYCLIESVSLVSNTAGVYGAFLKHWDSRAKKNIQFVKGHTDTKNDKQLSFFSNKVESSSELTFFNDKVEKIIESVECDILYLDPPYTQNQYGTQYHLLETLVLNDNPTMSKITGSRPTGPMRSDWSKDYKAHILFDEVLAKTKAKYIVFSYSIDGIMSKSFIEASLKRYGKPETYICKKIAYKKYRNFKTKRTNDHFEYLFFIEKKEMDDVEFSSPLNYIGSKANMIKEIKENLPNEIKSYPKFIDAFGGGGNVAINLGCKEIVYNDLNHYVAELIKSFKDFDTYKYIQFVKLNIKKFGLEAENSESYMKFRDYYNSLPPNKRDPKLLYTLILYGFNQQIRFNSAHEFNNPVGMRWFNDKVLEKLVSFSRVVKQKNIQFLSQHYKDFLYSLNTDDFVYMDPPYRLTLGSYNDGKRGFKGWCMSAEQELIEFIDSINEKGIKFMLSYVLEHGDSHNNEIKEWLNNRSYKIITIEGNLKVKRKEVLVINY